MIRQGKPISLSLRLQTIADMVPRGGAMADVGCDHGFLDIYLVQSEKIPKALAMDVRKGPLAAAATHVKEAHLEDKIETRLSDGLEAFQVGEARTLVCAGMGGPLMQRILTAYPEKTASFQDFLLQPQSEIPRFRAFLRENGYRIVEERILWEDGKYYFPMLVRHENAKVQYESCGDVLGINGRSEEKLTAIFDQYGECLLREKDPLLLRYLTAREGTLLDILEKIGSAATGETGNGSLGKAEDEREGRERREERLREIKEELEMLRGARAFMEKAQ